MFNFNKPKQLELYIVTPNIDKNSNDFVFLTVTDKKSLCEEYINRRLFIENKEHYIKWCDLREVDHKDINNWEWYSSHGGNVDFSKYIISKIKYKIADVAMVFRMFNGCTPIGTSYEESSEINYFLSKFTSEQLEKLIETEKEKSIDNK
jgi:hypothetical protein